MSKVGLLFLWQIFCQSHLWPEPEAESAMANRFRMTRLAGRVSVPTRIASCLYRVCLSARVLVVHHLLSPLPQLTVHPTAYLSFRVKPVSIHLSYHLSLIYLSIYLSIYLYIYLYIYISIVLFLNKDSGQILHIQLIR